MPDFSSSRLWITAATLLGALVLLQAASHGDPIILREPLSELPSSLGTWSGEDRPLDEQILQAAGVNDYTNRLYSSPLQEHIQMYVGYYASQRTGDTIHSPKNCLPGAGWDPISSGPITIPVSADRNIVVNEYVVQQDHNEQVVFYWYQGRGRIIASEYQSKFWMVVDSISRNRTDSALVRLNTPMGDGEARARGRLVGFTQLLIPHLDNVIPR
jgi:EpsI family protein